MVVSAVAAVITAFAWFDVSLNDGVGTKTYAPSVVSRDYKLGIGDLRIDLTRIRGKAGLLSHVASRLELPNWFGRNWDALHDCLSDWSRTHERGLVILLENSNEFAVRYRKTFNTATQVFAAAAEQWRSAGKPFWVLIDCPSNWNSGLERFP